MPAATTVIPTTTIIVTLITRKLTRCPTLISASDRYLTPSVTRISTSDRKLTRCVTHILLLVVVS